MLKGISLLEKRVDKGTAAVCRQLLAELQNGKTLAQAMERNKSFFPPLVRALIHAGEQSGELQQILVALTDYYARQKDFQNFMIKALVYPSFILLSALGVLLFFLLYVLPELAKAYTALQAQQSNFLSLALQANSFLREYPLLIALVLFFISFTFYKTFPLICNQLLKCNWLKKIYYLSLEARFCRVLGLLLNSGINITDAVAVAGSSITDKKLLAKIHSFNSLLQRGMDISSAIQHSSQLFSPLTRELLTIGAATGYLPAMLVEAAQIAETDFKEHLARAQEMLTPALLLVAAALTAGIVYAVIGPMFELFSAIPEY